MSKTSLATLLILVVLGTAIFKFSLITDDPQSYCAFGPAASSCKANPTYNDLYQTLKTFSRALPMAIAVFLVIFFLVLIFDGILSHIVIRGNRESLVIRRSSYFRVVIAREPVLHWIELHEGGSPAAFA